MKPEKPLTDQELVAWESSRDLEAELLESVRQMTAGKGRVVTSSLNKEFCQTEDAKQAYEPFVLEDYVDNPVVLARIKADITQEQLAERLGVSQAYVNQIERRTHVTNKMLERVHNAIHGEK